MVRHGDHWTDRTTRGHIRGHMDNPAWEYHITEDEINEYATDECFEGIMQYLFDGAHIYAGQNYRYIEYNWDVDPTAYTIEKVVKASERIFVDCKITFEDSAERKYIHVSWETVEDLEADEKAWEQSKEDTKRELREMRR